MSSQLSMSELVNNMEAFGQTLLELAEDRSMINANDPDDVLIREMGSEAQATNAMKYLWLQETRAMTIDALCRVASNIQVTTEQFLTQLTDIEITSFEGLDRDSGKVLAELQNLERIRCLRAINEVSMPVTSVYGGANRRPRKIVLEEDNPALRSAIGGQHFMPQSMADMQKIGHSFFVEKEDSQPDQDGNSAPAPPSHQQQQVPTINAPLQQNGGSSLQQKGSIAMASHQVRSNYLTNKPSAAGRQFATGAGHKYSGLHNAPSVRKSSLTNAGSSGSSLNNAAGGSVTSTSPQQSNWSINSNEHQQGSFPPTPSPLMTGTGQGPRKSRVPPPPPTSAPPPPPPPKPTNIPPPPLSPPPMVPGAGAPAGNKIPPPPPLPPQINMDFTRPVSLGPDGILPDLDDEPPAPAAASDQVMPQMKMLADYGDELNNVTFKKGDSVTTGASDSDWTDATVDGIAWGVVPTSYLQASAA